MKKEFYFVFVIILLAGCIQSSEKKGSFIIEGTNPSNTQSENEKNNLDSYSCDPTPKEREFETEFYYEGPLIDAHLHMPVLIYLPPELAAGLPYKYVPVLEKDITSDQIICLMNQENIIKVIGFYPFLESLEKPSINVIKRVEEKHPGRILAFLLPAPLFKPNIAPEKLDRILAENPGVFKGYGELATYFHAFKDRSLDDPEFLEIYKIVEKHNEIIMIHPTKENIETLEKIIKENPKMIFQLHGQEVEDWLIGIIERNENVFVDLDAPFYQTGDLYASESAEEFTGNFRKEFVEKRDEMIKKWKPIIEANPDQFMWGTDRLETWHFDKEVGGLLVEFSRQFIGSLEPSIQEKFAYRNAERMLEKIK